ncbi:hypothetical protein MGMO_73c00140 [Methyloglobulus morosus KoM1]|uniref:Uncharacterized protein n=1 Tax=Methyloglobulus morosus KoM1 TaxID=1116472 RepID=V5BFM6_9GAMM|nr:hypothetical protein [Methyloglobulus morosus]ESS72075.1 hypothetical protein MGMO_73c00140 [Methyloglobulus morosus KoM1]
MTNKEELIRTIWQRVGITNENLKILAASRKQFIQSAITELGVPYEEASAKFNALIEEMIEDMDKSVKSIVDIGSNK